MNCVFVGSFDGALFDRSGCWDRLCSSSGEPIRAFCGQNRFFGEVKGPHPANNHAAVGRRDGDAAVCRDVDGAGRDSDGLLIGVEDGLALGRLEDSGGGAGESAIASVANTVGCLDREEALTLEGEIQWIASGSYLTLSQIETVSAKTPKPFTD